MKKFFLLFIILTLISCSKDDSHPIKYLKKMTAVYSDGSTLNTFFVYNGDKMVSMENENTLTEFTYTENLITSVQKLDKSTQEHKTLVYSYENGFLTQISSTEGYKLKYTLQNDGSVSYEKWIVNSENEESLVYHGVLTFQNDNLTSDDITFDNTEPHILKKVKKSYDYDTRKSPLSHVLGFQKLLDYGYVTSLNNVLSFTEESTEKDLIEDTVISESTFDVVTYKYDSDNYPIEMTSNTPYFGDKSLTSVKTLFFYN